MPAQIKIDEALIADFCRRWKITEFALFGSVLTKRFRPKSDVDVMVTFAPDAHWGLHALYEMEQELLALYGREIHLITRASLEESRNYIRRNEILSHLEVIHAAR